MKITKTWKVTNGKTVTITGILVTSKIINCDGDKVAVKCCEKDINVNVEGHGDIMYLGVKKLYNPIKQNGLTIIATVGRLGLTEEQANIIRSVEAEIEATPEWQAKIAKEKASEKAEEEYQKHYNGVKAMME